MSNEEYVEVKDVAKRWSCKEGVVYRLFKAHRLDGFRLGEGPRSEIRVSMESVRAWENRRREPPPMEEVPTPVRKPARPAPPVKGVQGLRHLRRA